MPIPRSNFRLRVWHAFMALSLFVMPARALIVFDNTNTTDPANGVPWGRVGSVQISVASAPYDPDASAVYVGNRYFVTANHVTIIPGDQTRVELEGNFYLVDFTTPIVRIDQTDMKVFRVLDPGTTLPAGFISMALPTNNETGFATIIGTGVGKGVESPGQGWDWPAGYTSTADDSENASRVKRWGTNQLAGSITVTGGDYNYAALATQFEQLSPPNATNSKNESAAAHGDSGGGMFLNFSGTWKLIGITSFVSGFGSSYYSRVSEDGDPDVNYFVRVRNYAHNVLYPNWKAQFNVAADSDDTDHDNMNSVLEYAFGGSPSTPDVSRLPTVSVEGSDLAITFYKRMTAADLVYEVWESPDLLNWSIASPTLMPVDVSGTVRRYKASVPTGDGPKFLQVRVTTLP